MTRPLIGITGSHDRATWDIWVDDVVLVPAAYTKAVERAGGQPVVIPPGDCDSSLVEKLDGLVVAGGADLNPGTYGEAPVPETADWRDRQDASERQTDSRRGLNEIVRPSAAADTSPMSRPSAAACASSSRPSTVASQWAGSWWNSTNSPTPAWWATSTA